MDTIIKFEVNKTYSALSACDTGCVFSFTVISRSDKFIRVRMSNEEKRLGVKVADLQDIGGEGRYEYVRPLGTYSMAPVITAIEK